MNGSCQNKPEEVWYFISILNEHFDWFAKPVNPEFCRWCCRRKVLEGDVNENGGDEGDDNADDEDDNDFKIWWQWWQLFQTMTKMVSQW